MDREHDPEAWVEIHANLGRVLALRQRGDVASARDGAVFHLRQAAELESELLERGRVEPEDLAHTLVMLATALTQRMDADESDDLVEAEAILRRAASLLEAGEADDLLVDCLTNLGNVQTLNGDFEGAATTYQRAMSYAEGAGSVIDVAVLRIDLATTLLLQAEADEGSEQETARAIHLLRHNLEVLDAGRHPYDRARTHATMAHAMELHGDADGAVAAYRTALEVLDPETLPQEGGRVAYHLADLLAGQGRWPEAVAAYHRVLRAVDLLYHACVLGRHQRSTLSLVPELHGDAAWALLHCGRTAEAAMVLERGRARTLTERLELRDATSEDLARHAPRLSASLGNALAAWQRFEDQTTPPQSRWCHSHEPPLRQARRHRQEIDRIVAEVRRQEGFHGFLRSTAPEQLEAAASRRRPLVYLAPTDLGIAVLVVYRDQKLRVESIVDTETTVDGLDELMAYDDPGIFSEGYVPAQTVLAGGVAGHLEKVLERAGGSWLAALAARLDALGAQGVTVVAGGRTALLPVHALPYDDGGTEVCLLDRFEVSYAPSAKTLNLLRRRRRNPQIRSCRLVALGDSRPSRGPLEHAPEEVRRVAALFPTACVRLGRDADMDFLTAALPDATHLLLACHGRFDPERPLSSYVELADDRWSARHVLDQPPPPGLRLAVLSACQSGLADFEHAPDEALGLTGALLHAGVPGVIASLWPVHDHSTALLMERFFEEHLADPDGDGRTTPPATALRKAQLWLRDEASGGELRHPYHWAAFALFGG